MDGRGHAQIDRFCRQYLQLEKSIQYPDPDVLRQPEAQETLFERLFADGAVSFPPPLRHRLKVLKELVPRIEASIEDWEEHGISENLAAALGVMLCVAPPAETEAVQQKSYVTYYLSLLATSEELLPSPSITLLEARSLIASAGTTGRRTWEAALHLGQYLCSSPSLVRGKSILELGAGTGYLSILCAKYLGASRVIASDGSDDVVNNLPDSIFLNGLQGSSNIVPMDLKWGRALVGTEDAQWNRGQPIDLVLGADITYDLRTIPSLIGTLTELSDLYPGIQIIICARQRNIETLDAFMRQCAAAGFRVAEIEAPVTPMTEQSGPFYDTSVPIRIIACSFGCGHLGQ